MARNRFIQTCIGAVLRELRIGAGFDERAAAARKLGTSPTKLARIEDGLNDSVEPTLVEGWARKFGASEEIQAGLFEWACLTRDTLNPNTKLAGFKSEHIFFRYLEKACSSMDIYESELISGMTQTENYVRDLCRASLVDDLDKVNEIIRGRIERQNAIFDEGRSPKIRIIQSQSSIDHMRNSLYFNDQVQRLREVNKLPNVDIGVLKPGLHPSMGGTYNIMRFGETLPTIVYIETTVGGTYDIDMDTVAEYRKVFDETLRLSEPLEEYLC